MKIAWIGVFWLLLLAVPTGSTQEDSIVLSPACDLAIVEQAVYCESCSELEPQLSRKGTCVTCGEKPSSVAVCVKRAFRCEGCGAELVTPDECCRGANLQRVTVNARIIHRCEGCGIAASHTGVCEDFTCRRFLQAFTRTCTISRSWPHGGSPTPYRRM